MQRLNAWLGKRTSGSSVLCMRNRPWCTSYPLFLQLSGLLLIAVQAQMFDILTAVRKVVTLCCLLSCRSGSREMWDQKDEASSPVQTNMLCQIETSIKSTALI